MKTHHRRLVNIAGLLGLAAILIAAGVLVYKSSKNRQHQIDISVGAELYAANCASCHGADLRGEPDWQTPNSDGIFPAPPHNEDGHTWHHSDRLLFAYIKLGGAGALAQDGVDGFKSGMPAFEDVLTDAEIDTVLEFIKSSWPEDIRTIQQDRTKADEAVYQ